MSSFKQLQVFKAPTKSGQPLSESTQYWKDFEFPTVINEYGGINCISVSTVKPFYVAATHASRVHIYDLASKSAVKSFSFSENVFSASFRMDAKLMCVGFESNHVKVYPLFDEQQKDADLDMVEGEGGENNNTTSKPKKRPLRKFDDHLGPVHVCKFMRNLYNVMTASDDAHVRLFDLATSTTVMKLKAHKDYIRCGCTSLSSDDLILTGSYDHTIKLIDRRSSSVVMSVDHGEPVENILLYPSSNMIVSCGGQSIKIWDVLKGGSLMRTLVGHHKTVTSMAFSQDNKYLLSGGLDRHVKVFDLISFEAVCTIDYPSSVLSIGISPDDKNLIVGMNDGLISIKDRKKREKNLEELKELASKKAKSTFNPYKYVSPTLVKSSPNDHVISHQTKQHLKKYDKNLKKFNSSKALDDALNLKVRNATPQITIGVMQELIRRDTIRAALAGKSDKSLAILIKFIQRNISNSNYTPTLIDVSNIILDLYMNDIGKYAAIDDLFVRLKETIDIEVKYQTELFKVIGCLETIFFGQNNVNK